MGAMTSIFDSVASGLNKFGASLPSLDLDSSKLGKSIALLKPYWEMANSIFPMHEILIVMAILIAFAIGMFILWVIQRLINLIRGSG